jgi:iron complex outermembrane receptor protein
MLICACSAYGDEPGAAAEVDPDSTYTPDAGTVTQAVADSLEMAEFRLRLPPATILPSAQPHPGNVTLISRDDIFHLCSVSPAEALLYDTGARIVASGSYGLPQTLTLRSGRPNEIAYLLDGVPISDPQLEVFDLNWMPLAGMAAVEVVKGGASAAYGSGAGAGAVNTVTADAMPDVPLSEVRAWWGSFGSRMLDVSLRRAVTNRLAVLGAYENIKSDGWAASSSYQGERLYGKLVMGLGEAQSFEIGGFRYRGDADLPDSCPGFFDTGPGAGDGERDFVTASFRRGNDNKMRLTYFHLDVMQSAGTGTISTSNGRLDGVELHLARGSGILRGSSLGYRHKRFSGTLTTEDTSYELYGFMHGRLGPDGRNLAGRLRVERNSDFGSEVALSLAGRASVGQKWTVYGRLDRSYRYPSFSEVSFRSLTQDDGPQPDTEHSIGLEIGLGMTHGGLSADLALYWRDVDGMIRWKAGEDCELAWHTDSEAELAGLEVSAGFVHEPGVSSSVSYALTRAVDESGDDLEKHLSHILTWNLQAMRPLSSHVALGLGFAGRYVSAVPVGSRWTPCGSAGECIHDATLPAYTSSIGTLYLDVDRARVYARLRNVFDDDIYVRWGQPSLPGRSYEFGVSWTLED